MAAKQVGLGRGLNALIKDSPKPVESPVPNPAPDDGGVVQLPVNQIHKSPWQPRRHFDPGALKDLIDSVREHGILQPLLVRKVADGYQLIAGERRFRAAQEAELKDVPAMVLEVSDPEAVEITLIENLQREDLNPIEEAEGYQSLANEFGMTQERIAERVGKSRASIANALRLLSLHPSVRDWVSEGRLSSGHAKVLLGLDIPEEQEKIAQRALKEDLSVRALERIVNQIKRPTRKSRVSRDDLPHAHLLQLSDQLHQTLGTSIRLRSTKTLSNGKKVPGTIEIDFYSNEDLGRLLHLLGIDDPL